MHEQVVRVSPRGRYWFLLSPSTDDAMAPIHRREALRILGGLGLGSGLLGAASAGPSHVGHRDPPPWRNGRRPREGSDGRVVDLVLEGASAWTPWPDGGTRVIHDLSVRIAD